MRGGRRVARDAQRAVDVLVAKDHAKQWNRAGRRGGAGRRHAGRGSMMNFLMQGVPQLVSPWHVETFMSVRRLEANGFGTALKATGQSSVPEEITKASG